MPRRATTTFLLGVACIFAVVGVLQDVNLIEHGLRSRLVALVAIYVVISVGWAYFGPRRMIRSLVAVVALQFLGPPLLWKVWPFETSTAGAAEVSLEVIQRGWLMMVLILAGYLLLIAFFRMEGKRYFAAHTEMELASEIQKRLVPTIEQTYGAWEFYGVSIPSGSVGGDLLDLVESQGSFCAYVADVVGHGVRAGVLMSMVKSAVRMRLISSGARELLPALNNVLAPMTDSATYATFAQVSGDLTSAGDGTVDFALAAHPPILHYSRASGTVRRHSLENFPLAMFPQAGFDAGRIVCSPGDVLALVTDGLTEVFDRAGSELGDGYLERVLIEHAGEPLAAMAEMAMRSAERFGAITDDRTLLMIRRAGG